ncbi:MAG: hypothetical protein MJ244_02850 [Clostridia bacterium]|nr:hypothetical protein [Clostridia bacterium]
MAKHTRNKNIKTFTDVEKDELIEAEEEFNNKNSYRPVKTFITNAKGAIDDASNSQMSETDEYGNKYQTNEDDLSRMEHSISDSSKKVSDLINNIKRNDLNKSRDERDALRNALNDANRERFNSGNVTNTERLPFVDKETIAEAATTREQSAANKEFLDKAFDLPAKKKGLLERFTDFKNKAVTKRKVKVKKIKEKGLLNSLVEKTTGAGAKTVMGIILKWVFIVVIIIFLFVMLISVIFYFSNNYTRDPSNNLDARRLDTRVARAIYAVKENDAIKDLYSDLISSSSGELKTKFKKNLNKLVPSDALEKLRAAEDPDEAYILQDSSNWYLLYLERLSYAYGGYLDWEPEYLEEGAALADTTDRDPAGENVDRWRQIAEEVGRENGIDPNILLALVDIESAGNQHAECGSHQGLGQIGEGLLSSYFKKGDKYYGWTDDMRMPHDTGSCDWRDSDHQENARMQFTYIARRLTHQMAAFLKNNKGVSLSSASAKDKKTAIAFAVTGYNQGEARQLALYKTYGDMLYDGDGSNYASKFLKHVDTRLQGNYKMVGANQANYLKLFYKFYNYYSGTTIDSAMTDITKWYEAGDINSKSGITYGPYPGPVTEQTKLVKGSSEKDTINELKEKFYVEELTYIVDQYNRWMKNFTNYYLNNYPDKFIYDKQGNLIPEIYEKNVYGEDLPSVIKYQSYIHSMIDAVTSYDTKKTYTGETVKECYVQLIDDLNKEYNDELTREDHDELHELLNDLEDDLAINRYEMSFEVLRTVDSDNEMLKNDEAIETLERSLSYSVPIYEYYTLNKNKANKSFFDYEIYNENYYNDDYTLKIEHKAFQKAIDKINNININIKSLVKNKWSADRQQSAEQRIEDAFNYMYLNNEKPYQSKNHYTFMPKYPDLYYYYVSGRFYDRMVEKVHADEIYINGTPNQNTSWSTCGNPGVEWTYQGLETEVLRDYYLSNLKPASYTSLKYIEQFDYVGVEDGDRDIESKEPTITYLKGTVKDDDGNEVATCYKKIVSRQSMYLKEKVRNATIKNRALRNK